ncbi:unnamed protein product, partial [Nesidiocoris tenuis]
MMRRFVVKNAQRSNISFASIRPTPKTTCALGVGRNIRPSIPAPLSSSLLPPFPINGSR